MKKSRKLTAEMEAVIQAEQEAQQNRRKYLRRELLGMFAGGGLAMMIGSVIPAVRENVSSGVVILWGGAIGGALVSLERFERAGAVLTKRENRVLNYFVGLGIPVSVLLLLTLIQ